MLTREADPDALETACELELESGIVNAIMLQNAIRRLIEPIRSKALNTSVTIIYWEITMSTDLLTQLKALHLYGMRDAWFELSAEMSQRKQVPPQAALSQLINAGITDLNCAA